MEHSSVPAHLLCNLNLLFQEKMPINSIASKSDHSRNLIIQTKAGFLNQRRAMMMMTPFLPFFSSYLYLPAFILFPRPLPLRFLSHAGSWLPRFSMLCVRHLHFPVIPTPLFSPASLTPISFTTRVSLSGWMKFVAIELHACMYLRVWKRSFFT